MALAIFSAERLVEALRNQPTLRDRIPSAYSILTQPGPGGCRGPEMQADTSDRLAEARHFRRRSDVKSHVPIATESERIPKAGALWLGPLRPFRRPGDSPCCSDDRFSRASTY